MKILIANGDDVKTFLSMSECIRTMESMFKALVSDEFIQPERSVIGLKHGIGQLVVMPALVNASSGAKIMTIFPKNLGSTFETIQGAVLLFEPQNGRLLGIFDSTSITALRTAAVSAVATNLLAREDASKLAILGSGTQARAHLEAMSLVRDVTSVIVWSRDPAHSKRFSTRQNRYNIVVSDSAREAVLGADIVCTTTSSLTPVLHGDWLSEGTHVNAIGAYTASSRELDSDAVKKSRFFVDRLDAAKKEAGDYLIPMREGAINEKHIVGELGELLSGKVRGRSSGSDVTVFKSVGLAIEDIAASLKIYNEAISKSMGTWVEFGKLREE